LSNWHLCDFRDECGTEFNCSEQYMMLAKAEMFNDMDTARLIMEAPHPREQKALGRQVKGFDKEKWEAQARDIVEKGCYFKFSQNEYLKRFLLNTGDTILVEASPYDCVWGIGIGPDDPRRFDEKNWRGTNWWGEVLMRVRTRLKD